MAALPSHELAGLLASEIRLLPAGHRVPSEHTIMERFAVSRSTVRAAMKELQEQYLVRRVRGAGTFVNRRIDYVISRDRRTTMQETAAATGARVRTVMIGSEEQPAPDDISELLDLHAGSSLHRITRLGYVDDAVVSWAEEWVPQDISPIGSSDQLGVGLRAIDSLDQLLRGLGHDPVRSWCRIGLETAPEPIRDRLELDGPGQAWLVTSLSRDRNSRRPLTCGSTWSRPDMIRMVLELED
ncbi:GntR family transcriptional regulator [Microlunatus soli]|uniref:Transcriptional regulator, GntR family n=1 Tax=Microlunatus soli TaxID=630515 RepID=A0A1H1N1D4_9ACTN|nr:GntR family transcriptional regulator [Microlunatus soli]SDR92747.1 transcriptional regulator, GntR family [Microlunatus soli]